MAENTELKEKKQEKETAENLKSRSSDSEGRKGSTGKNGGRKKSRKKFKVLVIVESPTKTRSLSKFLGKDYRIESSKGHLIDLPKSSMGIDVDNNFEPKYITIRGKGKTLAELKKAAKSANEVLLATDPDREGEAISWHLERALSTANEKIKRVEFNEITEDAVVKAIENPREIDILRVNSQQARRILDRLVGYSISPILQEKFGSRRFSAGRVQSAALKIICEREQEIEDFRPKEYWEVETIWQNQVKPQAKDKNAVFKLVQVAGEKPDIGSAAEVEKLEKKVKEGTFSVTRKKISERRVNPPSPYITSRLQQDASTRLGFRAQKTMSVAQTLYEGVEMADGSVTGLITYMRTDSARISETGLNMAREYIADHFDEDYLPESANIYTKSQKQAQDAHEAIRPTAVTRTPESVAHYLTRDQLKLYKLIWSRFVASQMTRGIDEQISLEVSSDDEEVIKFRFSSSRQKFPGFRAVYASGDAKKMLIPGFEEGDKVDLAEFIKHQKFTQPPPRYTEASLIKVMEESGIGRPATYVPTMATLDKRAYIERKGRQLKPTQLGRVVNDMMIKHFPDIVDVEFTASMEEQLDEVAQGDIEWQTMLAGFFSPFQKDVDKAAEKMEDMSHLIRIPIGRECPECGHDLMQKLGKNGFFIGCSNFTGGCFYTESIPLGTCPLCGGNVVKKKSKKGRTFYGCEKYAETGCEFTMLDKPSEKDCPRCGSIMGQKVKKSGITLTCQNQECRYSEEQKTED